MLYNELCSIAHSISVYRVQHKGDTRSKKKPFYIGDGHESTRRTPWWDNWIGCWVSTCSVCRQWCMFFNTQNCQVGRGRKYNEIRKRYMLGQRRPRRSDGMIEQKMNSTSENAADYNTKNPSKDSHRTTWIIHMLECSLAQMFSFDLNSTSISNCLVELLGKLACRHSLPSKILKCDWSPIKRVRIMPPYRRSRRCRSLGRQFVVRFRIGIRLCRVS